MAVAASEIVAITTVLSQAPPARDIGKTLFLTGNLQYGVQGARAAEYNTLAAVANVFQTADQPYRAAQAYFADAPASQPYRFPPQPLVVGLWYSGGPPVGLDSGDLTDVVYNAGALDASDATFRYNGHDYMVDLSGQDDSGAVATALQTAIAAQNTGATVAFASQTMSVRLGSGDTSFSFFEPHSQGTGTDISAALHLTRAEGATLVGNGTAETLAAALAAIDEEISDIYFVTADNALTAANISDISAWSQTRMRFLVSDTNEAAALTANESTSAAAMLSVLQPARTALIYSATQDYKALSVASLFSGLHLDAPRSLITAKFKELPGRARDDLTKAQRDELTRKRINWYGSYGTRGILAEGETLGDGWWLDVRYWLDWFTLSVQNAVMDRLMDSKRIPQTPTGMNLLDDVVEGVCELGVANGGIAPGQLSQALTAQVRQVTNLRDFDGDLSRGYLIHIGSLNDQSQAARAARNAPPIRVFLKGSGALHYLDIVMSFED